MHNVNTQIFSIPRSGTTWYQQHLAQQHGLENLHEAFDYSQDPAMKSLRRHAYQQWLDPGVPCVVKIFPHHMTTGHTLKTTRRLFPDVHDHAQRTIFIVREDFDAQVRSLVVASALRVVSHVSYHAQWEEEIYLEDSEALTNLWKLAENFLYSQMWTLGMMYKTFRHPTHEPELVYTSELPQEHKYVRPVKFETEPEIHVPDFRKHIFEADGTIPFSDILKMS